MLGFVLVFLLIKIIIGNNNNNLVDYCSVDFLCNQEISYSYPQKGYSEVFRYLSEPIFEDICLTIQPLHPSYNTVSFDTHALYCNTTQRYGNSEVDNYQLIYLPFIVPEGLYSIEFFEVSRAKSINAIFSQVYYFTEFLYGNALTFPIQIMHPSYGSLKSRTFSFLVSPPVSYHRTFDGIFLAIEGIFHSLLPTDTRTIDAQSVTEPATWFLSVHPILQSNLFRQLIVDLELLTMLEPDILPVLYGEKQMMDYSAGENIPRRLSPEEVSLIQFGLPNYRYIEFILSDEEILAQRLFHVKENIQNEEQLQRILDEEKRLWKEQLRKVFEERGFNSGQKKNRTLPGSTGINKNTKKKNDVKKQNNKLQQNPFFQINPKSVSAVPQTNPQETGRAEGGQSRKDRKMNICIKTGNSMDGQKKIFLQQTEFMNSEKFNFIWIISLIMGETIEKYEKNFDQLDPKSFFHHLFSLQKRQSNVFVTNSAFNTHLLQSEDLEEIPVGETISAAMIWEQNKTRLYEYMHQHYVNVGGNLDLLTPSWCKQFYEVMKSIFLDNSCDLMIYGNARGFTSDVFITDVGKSLSIPTMTELLNLYLDERGIPDIIVAPSLHSLNHDSVQLPVASNQLYYSFKQNPLGVVIAPSVDYQNFFHKHYEERIKQRKAFRRAKSCDLFNHYEFPYEVNPETDVFIRHYPCILIGFVARLAGGELMNSFVVSFRFFIFHYYLFFCIFQRKILDWCYKPLIMH
jgi:hypothetical protein